MDIRVWIFMSMDISPQTRTQSNIFKNLKEKNRNYASTCQHTQISELSYYFLASEILWNAQ